jgi:hypothetical protein
MDSDEVQKLLQKSHPFLGHRITLQVMAVANVSPSYEYAVDPLLKSFDHVVGGDSRRTHDPNYPDVGRVLNSAYARKVRSGIGTPVTEKGQERGLKMILVRRHEFSFLGCQSLMDHGVKLITAITH